MICWFGDVGIGRRKFVSHEEAGIPVKVCLVPSHDVSVHVGLSNRIIITKYLTTIKLILAQ